MRGVDAVRQTLQSTQHLVTWFLSDLSDADLMVRPTAGANHVAWQIGHLILAEQGREQARLDEVWFVPAAEPPHKRGRRLTPFRQRVEMLQLAVAGHPALADLASTMKTSASTGRTASAVRKESRLSMVMRSPPAFATRVVRT